MIIALDVGLKRIGVALAPDDKTALPSEPILRKNRVQAAHDVSQRLKSANADKLVVGLPKGGSSEAEMERRIKHFISLLDVQIETIFIDECYSSIEASEFVDDKKRDGKLDSIAASIILQRYLSRV